MRPQIKIPSRFAEKLGVSKSLIVLWNQGKRKIPDLKATAIVDHFADEGVIVDLLDIRPDLNCLKPYLCQVRRPNEQRKLCKES
jgi:DNA-binding transcriptional regulator YdaS (Cro superfamily)